LIESIMRFAGNGTGDTIWKIPGQINWSTHVYDPYAPITKDSTTLYASDRDVFVFLVDDTHPIEVGKLDNGDPDLMFRGIVASNSEVGSRTLTICTFYLRGVCQNRTIWGAEGVEEIKLRHSKMAPTRFAAEAAPALLEYANASTSNLVNGVKSAKAALVARNDEEGVEWLQEKGKFSKALSSKIMDMVLDEEGHPARSVYDFVQGVTAFARGVEHQDQRTSLERLAGKWMSKVAA